MVNMKTIDAKVLSRMFLAGAKNLEAKKEWINELNVFPVPDSIALGFVASLRIYPFFSSASRCE